MESIRTYNISSPRNLPNYLIKYLSHDHNLRASVFPFQNSNKIRYTIYYKDRIKIALRMNQEINTFLRKLTNCTLFS